MCMADDGEGSDFLAEAMRRARKAHECYECGRTVSPGERYEHVTARWTGDDRISTVRTCSHCLAARRWLSVMCNGWLYGGVAEDLAEHAGEGHGQDPWLAAYRAGMSRRWRRRDRTLMPAPPPCPSQAVLLRFADRWATDGDRPWVL